MYSIRRVLASGLVAGSLALSLVSGVAVGAAAPGNMREIGSFGNTVSTHDNRDFVNESLYTTTFSPIFTVIASKPLTLTTAVPPITLTPESDFVRLDGFNGPTK